MEPYIIDESVLVSFLSLIHNTWHPQLRGEVQETFKSGSEIGYCSPQSVVSEAQMSLQGPVEDQSCLVHRVQEAEDRVRGKGSDIDPQGHTSITHPDMPRVCSVSPGWFPRLPM